MNFKNHELKIPIIFNVIILLFLYIDFFIPSDDVSKEKFDSFYYLIDNSQRIKGGGGKVVRNFLECKSGRKYPYVKTKDSSYILNDNEPILITKTQILSKVKSLKSTFSNKEFYISLLVIKSVYLLSIIAIIVSIINIFIANRFFEILLAFSSAYVFLISIIYLYYF